MIRWRTCLVFLVLLVLPNLSLQKEDDEEDKTAQDTPDEEDDDPDNDDDAEEDVDPEKKETSRKKSVHRTIPPKSLALSATRPSGKHPPECYTCAYKIETPLRACLDPTKYKVHVITCHNIDDKCFTSVVTKGTSYEAVVRGCRTGCISSSQTTCCEMNRCNNQAFAMPSPVPQKLTAENKSNKTMQPSVFFFVTILLVLQTVVKVSFV